MIHPILDKFTKNLGILFLSLLLLACNFDITRKIETENLRIGTKADRELLFDSLYNITISTEAFSPIKEEILGISVAEELKKCEKDIVNATTEVELYFAIKKFSAARRDRHLNIRTVDGGLIVNDSTESWAPVKFLPDYSTSGKNFLFVADIPKNLSKYISNESEISIGDKLIAINGRNFQAYFEDMIQYFRYSAVNNLWRRVAYRIPYKNAGFLPPRFYDEMLHLKLERSDGSNYEVNLPYLEEYNLEWIGVKDIKYPGYTKKFETECYHLYLPDDPDNKSIVLWWYGFRRSIDEDMIRLMKFSEENNLLNHDIILDMTESRGGSRGASLLTRIYPKPYKTTFGNLRLSEIGLEFAREKLEKPYKERLAVLDNGAKEGDNAQWVLDWLEQDVYPRYESGEEYSSNVPFKCAHAPHTSNGILYPADIHFNGRIVCLFSPWGGSHLDQFSTIFHENQMGYSIGMPTGGYSNTWEARKTIYLPRTQQPLLNFMWNIGHTISPNGRIVEGKAAPVDQYVPLTSENHIYYLESLLEIAHNYLDHKS